jgi:hypothetical protein
MTRTDIYKASKSIFPGLADEETFAMDMQDTEKANRAFQSALNNKDKYDEMGVTLPDTVEEFQAIVTTDPKKKSTNTGSNGSQKTQQSSGSKPAQSSQQGPKVFQPQRVFNSAEEIDNYFGYLDQYKNDPKAQKEKQWFEQNYPTISEQFWNQGGKPLTVQGPVYEEQKQPSVNYQSNLPKVAKKSNVDNRQFLKKEEEVVNTMPEITDEELMQGVMGEISPRQDNLNIPLNIQQEQVQAQKQIKREEEGEKVKGKTAKELVSSIEKENFYSDNYPKIESLINNDFGTRSNDIDFTKLNVNNRSELEDAYGRLEQDYLEYLQKTDPQEYERVNNEITSIRSKKGSDINRGERMVVDNFRSKAMEMHNLVNGYIMHEIEKNYDLPAYFGAASAMSMQIDSLDKQIQNLGIDPSGRGVSPAKAQQYQSLVDQRNKLVGEYNGLDEKFAIPKEVVAKYEDVANRYLDNSVIDGQLNNLDTELAAKRKENMKAAQERFNEAFSGDYSISDEVARGFTNTVGRAAVDLVTTAWDVIGETTGDTDYDIWDEIANFGRGYNFEKEKTFGAAQDFGFEPREYSELPLAYRMAGLTGSGLGSVTLSAAGAVLTGGLGLGSTVGGGVLMLGSSLSDNYNEALRNGYSGKDAAYYASTMAGIEMAVESLFPDFDFLKSPEGKKQLLRSVVNSKTPKEAFEKLMSGLPENVVKEFKIAGNNFLKEGVVEEGGSQFISDIVKSKFNEKNKDKGQFEVFKGQDYQDAILGGFLGAESANIIGRMASPKMPHEESIIYQAAINPDILSLSERNSIVVSDEIKDVVAVFKDIDNAMKSKPGYSNLSDDEKAHVVSEVQRMKYLEEQNKKVGIDDKATQDEISNIKSEVDTILNDSITKTKENALQEPSTEEVLPRQQGATTETGGQPQGMGQSVQGEVVAQEGQEVSQEGVKKEDVVNQPFGELPENTEDFTGIGAGYLKNNLWASKQLGKDSKTSLLGNVKNEVLNKGKKAFLYFIDPKLSEGQLDTENKYNTKLNDKINAQGNKTLSGAENAAIENEVGAELAKEGVKGELVSDEKDGTYRIFDTKNTELLGYIEATPELIEKISDPNISEEQAKQILFDEAGVKMGDNVLIHANENDLSKYKTQKDVEASAVPAGKKLFNEPNPETAQISEEYKKSKGIKEGPGSNITKLDTDRAMKIADAYDQMEDTPNDPEVQKAYQKLADETLDQFNAITDKGYTVELWEGEAEPYANSEEMIKDLKDNKHMYIFSTEQGFGDNPITDEQRKQNKLLEDSKFKDKNGKPLLYNDLFRFVHDFFGHSERGNGFGPVGEENAWDVHARMYTPLARRAMTTETRGQNSWVNFGPQMRNEDGSLKKPSDPGYLKATERRFADQKMGLLPEEFSQIEETPTQNQEVDKKSTADKIRGLKSKGGKLYSAGLGIPVAIWDGAVEIIASAVEAGESVSKALNKAKKYLKDNLKDKYNEDVFNKLKEETEKQSGEKSNVLNIDIEEDNPVYFENLKDFASASSFANKIEFKKAIQERLNSYMSDLKKKYGKSFNPAVYDEKTMQYLSDIITNEAVNAISQHPEAIGWYDEKTRSALDAISAIHPEIAIDDEARGAFILPLAIMSNGNKVDFNFDLAEKQYDYFKNNGRFNPNGNFGLQQSGIKKSLLLINSLLDNGLSMSDINTFLTSKYRAGDLKVKIDGKVKNLASGELAEELVYGATILGPKIGNGFYMNLWGQFDQLTMDRWFMRTWGRLTGTLLKTDAQAIAEGKKRVSDALAAIKTDPASREIFKSLFKNASGLSPVELAKAVEKASMDKDSRAILASNPKTDELRKAGNQLSKNISGEKEAPANGKERKFIREVFNNVQNRLKSEQGIDISMADLQAVLWYPEKILYESFKGGQTFEEASEGYTSESAPDYFNAAKKLAFKLGKNETEINEALSRGRERTQRSIGTTDTGAGQSAIGANKEVLERVTETIGKPTSSKIKSKLQTSNLVEDAVNKLSDAEEAGGSEIIVAQKEVSEKLGEEGKKIAEIDRNFDKLADDLGFIKTCII